MEIYLIRHTTPSIAKGLIYGRKDVGLAKECDAECSKILDKLPKDFDAVFSSPSSRCTFLARKISRDYSIDERLYEVNFGLWEGKTWDTVEPGELKKWMEDFVHSAPPEGESMIGMQERVMEFWNQLFDSDSNYKRVVIVTHGGVMRLIIAVLTHTALENAFDIKISYGDIFMVDHQLEVHRRI